MDEAPFLHVLGVGSVSTLNVDGGHGAWRRFPCGFSAPGAPWERLYGPNGCSPGCGDVENGRGRYVASEQVLSWAQKEGWWR